MNMKKEDVIFERREFLNLPGHNGQANIVANIIRHRWDEDKLYRNVDVKLDIADCSRVITMDIYVGDGKEENENALHKVDTLIDVLSDFKKALKKEIKIQERLAVKKAKRDEKEKAKQKEEDEKDESK